MGNSLELLGLRNDLDEMRKRREMQTQLAVYLLSVAAEIKVESHLEAKETTVQMAAFLQQFQGEIDLTKFDVSDPNAPTNWMRLIQEKKQDALNGTLVFQPEVDPKNSLE